MREVVDRLYLNRGGCAWNQLNIHPIQEEPKHISVFQIFRVFFQPHDILEWHRCLRGNKIEFQYGRIVGVSTDQAFQIVIA